MRKKENTMLVKVNSIAILGLEVLKVTIEVNIASRGFPSFDIVGLPTKTIAESKERIKTALINSGINFPDKKITVNLAPADLQKEGTMYDFPIAAGIIAASKGININNDSIFFGELSLDGSVKPTKGIVLLSFYARENNLLNIYIPENSANETDLIGGINVFKISNLSQFVSFLEGRIKLPIHETSKINKNINYSENISYDMSKILGQPKAKRALEISAAGGHNLLFIGSPGVGKTALIKTLPSILPPLSDIDALEVLKIYSSIGMLDMHKAALNIPPIRSPHHTISYSGLVGGGAIPKVGELSLAHKGILFLDEFPEFPKNIIESLRQPMEDGKVTVSRTKTTSTFPCDFTLVATANPCPCGYYGHPTKECKCSDQNINRYRNKLSGPILDRIDIFVELFPLPPDEIEKYDCITNNENSLTVRNRVINARNIQMKRNQNICNAKLNNLMIPQFCKLDSDAKNILNLATTKLNLSPRSYFKILKVARTIADLETCVDIKREHVAEAIQYKSL